MTETSRVKEADRDAVIDALTDAFVEGHLTPEQHDKRVSAALRARRIGTLGRLLEGVQLADGHPVAPLVAVATFTPVNRAPSPSPPVKWTKPWTTKAKIALCAPAVLAVALMIGLGVVPDDEPAPPLDDLSVAGIERFVADVDEEFGSTEVLLMNATETSTSVWVPSDQGGGRYQPYTYRSDYGFTPQLGGTMKESEMNVVDLGDLDVEALAGRTDEARTDLGVVEVSEVTVKVTAAPIATDFAADLDAGDVPPHIEIEVRNDFQESGRLTTDLSGDEVLDQQGYESRN